jgi:hypothetical protein
MPNSVARQDERIRPEYILESLEDVVYHEARVTPLASEPEFCAFLDKNLVFNRAMNWLDAPGNTLICLCEGGNLHLTGTKSISKWFSDPSNGIDALNDDATRFTKKSARQRDCLVLPALQFSLEQHPIVELTVSAATTDWQFCIIIKGRSGPPIIASPWNTGAGTFSINIHDLLQKHGYDLHFAELSFVLGSWNAASNQKETIDFSLQLKASPAIMPCLPVVRTLPSTNNGVPVSAVVLNSEGKRLTDDAVSVTANVATNHIQLSEQDGIWSGLLTGLDIGDHTISLTCEGIITAQTKLSVRVTDGEFINYDASQNFLNCKNKPLGPLTGSYQGMVFARDVGTSDETIINGEKAFAAWDNVKSTDKQYHYWEALTESELDTRFHYLEECGWNLLHLCQHWALWEKLDAGGHIAPHGAEQVALYYRTAAKHGLSTVQALSHYPYDSRHTPPCQQYIDNGFKDGDWQNTASAFTKMFHGYLKDYATLFGDETAIAYLTTSGEGDIAAGPDRVNDTCAFMTKHAPNLLFLSEPVHRLEGLPEKYYKTWNAPEWITSSIPADAVTQQQQTEWQQPMFGSRLYWIGESFEPELDLGIEFKLMQLAPIFMGEGSWPNPHRYSGFMNHARTWCATPEYRSRVRDTLCLGLIHRNPVMLTWDEQLAEDEHRIVNTIRRQIDWTENFMNAPVAIRVNDDSVGKTRTTLQQIEAAFSAIPLATRYISDDAEEPTNTALILDARNGFNPPDWIENEKEIPEELQTLMPIKIRSNQKSSTSYRVSYCWSKDRHTLLAYFYNCMAHEKIDHKISLGGCFHRKPEPTELQIRLQNFPAGTHTAKIYDLDAKKSPQETEFSTTHNIDQGITKADFFLFTTSKS